MTANARVTECIRIEFDLFLLIIVGAYIKHLLDSPFSSNMIEKVERFP